MVVITAVQYSCDADDVESETGHRNIGTDIGTMEHSENIIVSTIYSLAEE